MWSKHKPIKESTESWHQKKTPTKKKKSQIISSCPLFYVWNMYFAVRSMYRRWWCSRPPWDLFSMDLLFHVGIGSAIHLDFFSSLSMLLLFCIEPNKQNNHKRMFNIYINWAFTQYLWDSLLLFLFLTERKKDKRLPRKVNPCYPCSSLRIYRT